MKVTVVGLGAVGGFIAARLAEAGTPVSALARGAHFHRRAVEIGRVAQHDFENRLRESILRASDDLHRERAGEFE